MGLLFAVAIACTFLGFLIGFIYRCISPHLEQHPFTSRDYTLVVMFIIGILGAMAFIWAILDCHSEGGQLMRSLWGFWSCVKTK